MNALTVCNVIFCYSYLLIGGPCTVQSMATITVTDNNPRPSTFVLTPGSSQLVTLGPGDYSVTEMIGFGFIPIFSGDCMQTASGSFTATGTISAGEHQTCTIINNQRPG